MKRTLLLLNLIVFYCGVSFAGDTENLVTKSNVYGGLIVSIGNVEADFLKALRINDSYTVEGVSEDSAAVNKARTALTAESHGRIGASEFDGTTIPFIDNIIQLLIISKNDSSKLKTAEIDRVVAPFGVVLIKNGADVQGIADNTDFTPLTLDGVSGWTAYKKKYPETMDEWTHFLHAPDGNVVAKDKALTSPFHLQWISGPELARDHGRLASTSGCVSANGRLFTIMDEGPNVTVSLPPDWQLIARDAFSGVLLWKRKIGAWEGQMRPFRSGPAEISRRIVAVGDKIYVTLSYTTPVEELDAATGKTIKVYKGTENAYEIIYEKGVLYLVISKPSGPVDYNKPGARPAPHNKKIVALDAETGNVLWEKDDETTTEIYPLTLCTADSKLYYQEPKGIHCIDASTGKEIWFTPRVAAMNRLGWAAPTMLISGDVLLCADIKDKAPKGNKKKGNKKGGKAGAKKGGKRGKKKSADSEKDKSPESKEDTNCCQVTWKSSPAAGSNAGELVAYSAKDGKELWRCSVTQGYNAPIDVFVIDDIVWYSDNIKLHSPTYTDGRDLHTGKIVKNMDTAPAWTEEHHQRCYRNKATSRYIITGRQGVEFLPVDGSLPTANYWTRGECQYGVMPCNGLLYTPPHACSCYIQTKLNNYNALAGRRDFDFKNFDGERLTKGEAFDDKRSDDSEMPKSEWWTYRSNPERSSCVETNIPVKVKNKWQQKLDGVPTAPVAAEGFVLLAIPDKHKVSAFHMNDGSPAWTFYAGGRVDSPPTIYKGKAIFGAHDGYVYCLRLKDGALMWRFLAARNKLQHICYEQVESVWPVMGSVLIKDGIVYALAGRSSYVDGGMVLWRLNPDSGEIIGRKDLFDLDLKTGSQKKENVVGMELEGALPDIMAASEDSLFLRDLHLSKEGKKLPYDTNHIFSNMGFLDDTYFNRGYWIYGKRHFSGAADGLVTARYLPSAYLMASNADHIFGFDRNQYIPKDKGLIKGSSNLYCAEKKLIELEGKIETKKNKGRAIVELMKPTKVNYLWKNDAPMIVRGMVVTDNALFIAGPEFPTLSGFSGNNAVLKNDQPSLIMAIDKKTGKKLSSEPLLSGLPVRDGLIASDENLFVTTKNGILYCLGQ